MKILVETSARHIHLSKADAALLFGKRYKFTKLKPLSQPGEYASKQTLAVIGKKSQINNVRILIPFREKSQLELSATDCHKIGIRPVVRLSGKTSGAPKVFVQGPKGSVKIPAIVSKRHLHLSTSDAKKLKIKNKQKLKVKIHTRRPVIFEKIIARIGDSYKTSLHLDTDEANAAGIRGKTFGEIITCPKKS